MAVSLVRAWKAAEFPCHRIAYDIIHIPLLAKINVVGCETEEEAIGRTHNVNRLFIKKA